MEATHARRTYLVRDARDAGDCAKSDRFGGRSASDGAGDEASVAELRGVLTVIRRTASGALGDLRVDPCEALRAIERLIGGVV